MEIRVYKETSELKHKDIVDKLMKKCGNAPASMNYIQDVVKEHMKVDKQGVERFFDKISQEDEETKGQDCMLVNGILFDWKELNKPKIVEEFIELALNCMSEDNSRKKLESMLKE